MHLKIKRLVFCFILFQWMSLYAVNSDSLWTVWSDKTKSDTSRVKALNEYAFALRTSYPDSTIHYSKISWNFSKEINYAKGIDVALNAIGVGFTQKSEFDSALYYFSICYENALKRNDLKRMGIVRVNMGNIYGMQDMLMNSLDNMTAGVLLLERAKDTLGVVRAKLNLGVVYRKLDDLEGAMKIYVETLNDALKYNLPETVALAYNNIANIYQAENNPDSALYFYRLALPLNIEQSNIQGEARCYQNMAASFQTLDQNDSAFIYSHRALRLQVRIEDAMGIAGSYACLANHHYYTGKLDSAIYYANEILKLHDQIGAYEDQKNAHSVLAKTYEKKGNYKLALQHLILKTNYHDSISSDDNLKALARQEMNYEYQKEKETDSIKHSQKILLFEKESENQRVIAAAAARRNLIVIVSVVIVLILLTWLAFILYRSNLQQKRNNVLITEQKALVEHQRLSVQEKNAEITDSINYAKRIQTAILPPVKLIKNYLPDSFILYLPKDIVAGDFYWLHTTENKIILAVSDCTGHGVPGALVSVVCHNALTRSVREFNLNSPDLILNKTRELVIETFEKSEDRVNDGMDTSLVTISKNDTQGKVELEFSGANNPLYIIRNGELQEFKGDKQPVGKFDKATPFSLQKIDLHKGDMVFLLSDGYADQFGGPKAKKLKYQSLKDILVANQSLEMEKIQDALKSFFDTWRGSLEQVDDVCIIGFRVV